MWASHKEVQGYYIKESKGITLRSVGIAQKVSRHHTKRSVGIKNRLLSIIFMRFIPDILYAVGKLHNKYLIKLREKSCFGVAFFSPMQK